MNIVYASDDNYADIAGVSILSLFENNKDVEDIRVFMLDNGISDENKKRLSNVAGNYMQSITFVDMPDIEKMADISIDVGKRSLATFDRLFVASALPSDVDRILYLDCDTMIRGSLLPLWKENLNGNIIGGILDCTSRSYKRHIFLKNSDIYVNAGILLIDLKLWRKFDVEKKFINFIKLWDGKVPVSDQGVVNGILNKYIKLLHPKYNCSLNYIEKERSKFIEITKIVDFYDEDSIRQAKENPVIFHFFSCFERPWTKGNKAFFRDEYTQYRNMTPWANFPLREPKIKRESAFRKNTRKILKCLPAPIYKRYLEFREFIEIHKKIVDSKKRLRESDIKLEDCYIKYDKPHQKG